MVNDIDEPATAITLTPVAVDENVLGAVVADIAVEDPDAGASYDIGDLDLTGPDAALFVITGTPGALQLKLVDGAALDFEASQQPVVEVTLAGGGLSSGVFSPSVNDVTEAGPLSVTFTDSTITSYTTTQDKPGTGGDGATVSADGATLTLDGNLWKRASLGEDYAITDATELTLTVTISGNPAPEIVAIGFDDDETPWNGQPTGAIYQIGGTQRQQSFIDLAGTGAVVDNNDGTL